MAHTFMTHESYTYPGGAPCAACEGEGNTDAIQFLVWDVQENRFKRDFQIEQFWNDPIAYWEGGL